MEPLRKALHELGVSDADLHRCANAQRQSEVHAQLQAIKSKVHRTFRRKALELHPDRTNGDQSKAAKFRELAEAYELVNALQPADLAPYSCQITLSYERMGICYGAGFSGLSDAELWGEDDDPALSGGDLLGEPCSL